MFRNKSLVSTFVPAGQEFYDGFLRGLLDADKPSAYLLSLKAGGLLVHLPELEAVVGVPQNPDFHPEGDVWTHTLLVTEEAAGLIKRYGIEGRRKQTILLAALCHDFGKAVKTTKFFGRIISYGHEKAGAAPAGSFLGRLPLDSATVEVIVRLVENHHVPFSFYRSVVNRKEHVSRKAFARCFERLKPATLADLLVVAEADYCGRAIDYEYSGTAGNPIKRYPPGEWFIRKINEYGLDEHLEGVFRMG